jgi:hypothetical protein
MSSIKISQLPLFTGSISATDFFPIDISSSLLTYKATTANLRVYLSTGSFTGSFNGNHTGSFLGTGTSPQFIGTASYAISSSRATSASYSDVANSASYSTTASYALNSPLGAITGSGTLNYLVQWTPDGTTLGDSRIYYTGSFGYIFSDSVKFTTAGESSLVVSAGGDSVLSLTNLGDELNDWRLVNRANTTGILDLMSNSSSINFTSKTPNDPNSDGTITALRISSNGYYMWPFPADQTLSRDGTFNLGVESDVLNSTSRMLIRVYSGSNADYPTATVNHLRNAFTIQYGLSSYNTVFNVSSSGEVFATNYSGSDYDSISFYGSASYAATSSVAHRILNGTSSYLSRYNASNPTLLEGSDIFYDGGGYRVRNKYLVVSESVGKGIISVIGKTKSMLSLQGTGMNESDIWELYSGGTESPGAGVLELTTYSGSSNLSTKDALTTDPNGIIRTMRVVSNGFYFWPLWKTNSPSLDGTFNIGVQSDVGGNTETRFLIDVYSGSSVSNPQVEHLHKAIEVRYGSSSMDTTFCVSSSGLVTATGYSGSTYSDISFYGTSSYAMTSSCVAATYITNSLGIFTETEAATLATRINPTIQFHSLPTTPSYFKCVLYCNSADLNFATGHELDLDSVSDGTYYPPYISYANASYVSATSKAGLTTVSTLNRTTGAVTALTLSKWNIKYYWK